MTDTTAAPGDRLRAALAAANGANPDQVAQAQRRAAQVGAPRGALDGVPQAQWPAAPDEFDVEAFLAEYPRTAGYLEEPANARVAGADGRQSLSLIERSIYTGGDVSRRALGGFGTALGTMIRGAGRAGARTFDGTAVEGFFDDVVEVGTTVQRGARNVGGDLRPGERETLRHPIAAPRVDTGFGGDVAGGLGQLAAQALTLVATGGAAGTTLLGAQGVGAMDERVDEARVREGRVGAEYTAQEDLALIGGGAVTALSERLGLDAVLGRLPKPLRDRVTGRLGEIVTAGATEGLTEIVETVGANGLALYLLGEDTGLLDGTVEAGSVGAAVGSLANAIVQSATPGRQRRAQAVEQDNATVRALAEQAAASPLRERSPEAFEDALAQIADGGPITDLYISAEALNQSGVDIPALRAAVPAIDQQLDAATETGGDIRIPVGEFGARIAGTDFAEPLLDHMRANPVLPSLAEQRAAGEDAAVEAEVESVLRSALDQDAFAQSQQRVEQSLFQELENAKRFTADVNRPYAALVSNFYAAQARRLGITPEQMAERYQLRVQAELPQAQREATLDQPAETPSPVVKLIHFSPVEGLVETDPMAWGRSPATTRAERQRTPIRADDKYWSTRPPEELAAANALRGPPRTYFYRAGQRPEGVVERLSPIAYESEIAADALYDFDNDPLNLRPDVADPIERANRYEQAIRAAGFQGYFSDTRGVRGAVAVFDPLPLRPASLYAPVEGAPKSTKVNGERVEIKPFAPAREAAANYMASRGLQYEPPTSYAKVDPERAGRLAGAFDQMAHAPNDPVVRAAYSAMIEETLAQYQFIKATGLEVEFIEGDDPYAASPRLAIQDVVENNHLWVFPTDAGFGGTESADVDISGNPLLGLVDEWVGDRQLRANDVFRIVHDYFGHIKDGFGFRADGEENAWQSHAAMYSPLARRAMTTETRGQNSWVNFGPFAEFNKTANAAETQYAPQKIGLLPTWADQEGFLGGANSGLPEGQGAPQTLGQGPAPRPAADTISKLQDTVPGIAGVAPYLTPEERARLKKASAKKLVDFVQSLPSADEMASVAWAGRAKRGWYERSANALVEIFGAQDATRFAALLAALSPQTSVESNTFNALATWVNWNAAGRPTDRKAIIDVMGESVEGDKGTASILDAWVNNAVRALASDSPTDLDLSGAKVNSFFANLVGAVDEVTNDAWMGAYAAIPASKLRGPESEDAVGRVERKGIGYIAMNAVVRRAAEVLSRRTGETWTPAEVQETVWSWAKTLYEKRDRADATTEQILEMGGLRHEDIATTPDFALLFTNGVFRRILEAGGYGQELEVVAAREQGDRRTVPEGDAADAEGAGVAEDVFGSDLRAAARRLERVRSERLARAAEKRGKTEPVEQLVLFQSDVEPNPPFYSALTQAVADSKTASAPAAQWLATLRKTPGVKAEEIEWSGLEEELALYGQIESEGQRAFLIRRGVIDAKGNISRDHVLAFLQNGGVKVEEVVLGDPADRPEGVAPPDDAWLEAEITRIMGEDEGLSRNEAESLALDDWYAEATYEDLNPPESDAQFSTYKLPGADDTYREILLTLPNIDGPSTHWDEPNVVAHARITTRTDATGAKVLFLEEVQSDWHQKGRDQGYANPGTPEQIAAAQAAYSEVLNERRATWADLVTVALDVLDGMVANEEIDQTSREMAARDAADIRDRDNRNPVLAAIYASSALRRWSPYASEQQLEVMDADQALLLRETEARVALDSLQGQGTPNAPFQKSWSILVMKRMIRYAVDNGFDKVAWINGNQQNGGQTGGDGSFFYERNLVNTTNDLLKKMGGRVEPVDMRQSGAAAALGFRFAAEERPSSALGIQNGFTITDQMRAQAQRGFPLFQQNRGQIAFGQDITQSPSTISILRTADLSTFLHETGHFFLEVTNDIARRDDAPAEIKADMETLLSWFQVDGGIEGWNALPFEEKRKHHEQFARGFEAFLMEGRAPTAGLRELFQRFRSWLMNVYRSMTQLNVELTDDARAVMGRMVAADDEIKTTEAGRGFTPLAEKPPYMDDDTWAEYQRSFTEATEHGVDTLTTRAVRDMRWLSGARSRVLKRLQAQARDQRRAVKAEVTAEVMAEPVNRARQYLRRGTDENGDPIPGAGKLDLAILQQMYGDAPAAPWRKLRTGGKYGEAGNDGLHPDVVAELFGYDSGDALVRDLASAEDANEKIAGMTDQRMLERYGDLSDPQAIERAADEAVANDAHSRAIATDYAALIQATGQPRALLTQAKAYAASIVSRMELRQLKPNQFFAAMTRAGKTADKAAKAGDLVAAATARRNQLVNLQAAKAALEAKAEAEKALTFFNRIVTGKDDALARSRDMALVNAARAVLASYGIGSVRNDPASYLERVKSYDPQLYADIQPFVEGARGMAKPFDQITVEQMKGLRDTVNQLWVLSRRTRQIELDGVLVDINTARDALGARLDEIGYPKPVGQDQAPDEGQRFHRYLQGARAALRRVESWTRAVDAGDAGPFRTYIWNPVSTAADRYRVDQARYLRRFLDIVKPIEESLTRAKIAAPEIGYTFTGKAELLHAILHTGNGSNMSKLLLGRRWGEQRADGTLDTSRWDTMLERMWREGVLTKADYDFAQTVWDLLEETKPGAQNAHRAMYGRYFSEITAEPIRTPFGEYRGGYVPATTDSFLVQDAQLREEQNALEDSNAFMFPAASNGFTKSRVEDYTRELSLDIRLLPMHIDKVLKFTHLGPPVRDVARILRGRAFAAKLSAFDPVAASDLLLPWLQRAARQVVQEPSKGQAGRLVDGFFRELRNRTGMQLMFANLSNTLQQLTGFSNAAVRVKPSRIAGGLWSYLRDPKGLAEAVTELSPFMASRTSNQVYEMRQTIEQLLLNPSKYEKLRDFSQRHAYFMQFAFQNVVDLSTWKGAYEQAIERGDEEREAIRFADSVIRETQSSMAPEDVSRFETGTAFNRLFTQFYSYFNNQANLLGTEGTVIQRQVGLRNGAGRLLYLYVVGFAVPALLADAIATAMRGGLEDDEEDGYLDEMLQWFFGAQAKFAIAGIPVVGQITNAAIGGFTPAAYDDRISTSPAISVVESSARLPGAIYDAIASGEGMTRRDVRDVFNLLGLITGTPLGAAGRPVSYGYAVAQGEVEPTSAVDAARGLVTGTPSPESRTQ